MTNFNLLAKIAGGVTAGLVLYSTHKTAKRISAEHVKTCAADRMTKHYMESRRADNRGPVTSGLKETGAIIINTTKSADYLKSVLKNYNGNIYTIDAKKISEETIGKYFPNTPMLAAIVKVSGVMTDEQLLDDMKGSFKHKFAKKPEVIEGNMKALEMALNEVKKIN